MTYSTTERARPIENSRTPRAYSSAAGALVAVGLSAFVVVSLYFNTAADRPFDHQKSLLLIAFALVSLPLFSISLALNKRFRVQLATLAKRSEARALLAWVAVLALASAFSISPQLSWHGSYDRVQGLTTLLSGTALAFLLGVPSLGTHLFFKVTRIVTCTSLPIALYALAQYAGLDPFSWQDNDQRRATSHLGNPVHLGAWLAVAIPFSVSWLTERGDNKSLTEPNKLSHNGLRLIPLAAVTLQLLALYMSFSRGPLLGLIAGAAVAVVWIAIESPSIAAAVRRHGWAIAVAIALLSALGLKLFANVADSRPTGPQTTQTLGSEWADLPSFAERLDASSKARLLLWHSATNALSSDTHLLPATPDLQPEAGRSPLRLALGFGPETIRYPLDQYRSEDWPRVENATLSADRSHNQMWDALLATGLLGAGVLHLLHCLLYLRIVSTLIPHLTTPQKSRLVAAWWLCGSGAAATVVWLSLTSLAPLAVLLGSLTGMGLLATWYLFSTTPPKTRPKDSRGAITLLAALTAYLIEAQTGVGGTASLVFFFLLVALVFQLGKPTPELSRSTPLELGVMATLFVLTLIACFSPTDLLVRLSLPANATTTLTYASLMLAGLLLYLRELSQHFTAPSGKAKGVMSAMVLVLAMVSIINYPFSRAKANGLLNAAAQALAQHPAQSTDGATPGISQPPDRRPKSVTDTLQHATLLSPNEPSYKAALARVYLRDLPPKVTTENERAVTAINLLSDASALRPWSPTYLINDAMGRVIVGNRTIDPMKRNERLVQARQRLSRGIQMRPNHLEALTTLAQLQLELRAPCAELQYTLERAQRADSTHHQTLLLLAQLPGACLRASSTQWIEDALIQSFADAGNSAAPHRLAEAWVANITALQSAGRLGATLRLLEGAIQASIDTRWVWQLRVRKVDALRLAQKTQSAHRLAVALLAQPPTEAPAEMIDFLQAVTELPHKSEEELN